MYLAGPLDMMNDCYSEFLLGGGSFMEWVSVRLNGGDLVDSKVG